MPYSLDGATDRLLQMAHYSSWGVAFGIEDASMDVSSNVSLQISAAATDPAPAPDPAAAPVPVPTPDPAEAECLRWNGVWSQSFTNSQGSPQKKYICIHAKYELAGNASACRLTHIGRMDGEDSFKQVCSAYFEFTLFSFCFHFLSGSVSMDCK